MHLTLPLRQIVSNHTLEALKRSISKTIAEAAPHIQAAKENQVRILSQKFTEFNDWYMKITGLDKVTLAREKVNALQDQLLNIQEKRREVGRQLSNVRQKSMELQDEIHKVKRQEDLGKFLDLMKEETEVMRLEKSISNTFQDYDQTERELFTAFTDSIRDSHEKQRAQMEYTKYFGIVLSIAGSLLAFVYSTLRKEQLKQIIDDRLQNISKPNDMIFVAQIIDSNKKLMEEISNNKKEIGHFSKVIMDKFTALEHNIQKNNISSHVSYNGKGTVYTGANTEEIPNQSFFKENSNLLQGFGLVLGLWLISRSFF
ncbi:unnamed protein product [Ceutorhynchus assimilis]|uniref:Uncharacterized protein n=1 Tax=Ceutorhynchus assimilis TaxID=467358 RepID=A0A9N9QQJ2_9CUCU|nr:unnamed protein product [Ceutorhynchus assimilis]